MSSVSIYMEGGGEGLGRRAMLRDGMDIFLGRLKAATLARLWRWNLVPCGSRGDAFKAFRRAVRGGKGGVIVLLVDSEDPVTAATFREHLEARDGWTIDFAPDDSIHLMVQTMETWIVADRQTLADYFGEGFALDTLPTRNLEAVSKDDIAAALGRAVRNTRGRTYRKLGDGSVLLQRMDPEIVQRHCCACRRLFETLAEEIGR